MKRLLFLGLFVILALLVGSVMLTRCRSATVVDPQAAVGTETPAPTEEPIITPEPQASPTGPAFAAFTDPGPFAIGAVVDVPFQLIGAHDLHAISVIVFTPIMNIRVLDAELNTPETQVSPGPLPPGAMVLQNTFDASGRVTYEVAGLEYTQDPVRTLFVMQMVGMSPGMGELMVDSIKAWRVDGSEIEILPQPAFLEVLDQSVGDPIPQETLVFQVTAQPVAPAGVVAQGVYYRLRAGQNLYRVAQEFGSTVEAIAQANNITDVHAVSAGRLLHIPVTPSVGRAAYYVGPGDTLYGIARYFNLTVESLAAQNGLQSPYHLRAGQWVVLTP